MVCDRIRDRVSPLWACLWTAQRTAAQGLAVAWRSQPASSGSCLTHSQAQLEALHPSHSRAVSHALLCHNHACAQCAKQAALMTQAAIEGAPRPQRKRPDKTSHC